MSTNLELKARIQSLSRTIRVARAACQEAGVLLQTDTYFQVRRGRLKLREFSNSKAELIYYNRIEGKGERWSTYYISRVYDPSTLKSILGIALGTRIVVRKSRRLFFYKGARIHIDSVLTLGRFIEIEVIAKRGRNKARAVFAEIKRLFGIEEDSIIVGSYADLMEERSKKAHHRKPKEYRKGPTSA